MLRHFKNCHSSTLKTAIVIGILFPLLASCGGSSGGGGGSAGSSSPPDPIVRASLDSMGAEANGNSNNINAPLSTDGRYVAFQSAANNLVAVDANGVNDVFVRDTQTGITTRVSVDSAGVEGTGDSMSPSLSADGRYVVFGSNSVLVAGDTNALADIFVRDTQAGTTTRVSVDSMGVESNRSSSNPSLSADGRYVAFQSGASNLVAGDMNGFVDIFIRDIQTGTTTRVSVDSMGVEGNEESVRPSLSADGRYVVFRSDASNLVTGDINGFGDIFVHDTQTGTTTRVSVNSAGVESNSGSDQVTLSADGRYVVFESNASNLVAGDINAVRDIFVRDTQAGTTTRASVDSMGLEGNSSSSRPSLSADGRYVVFESLANNLVAGDMNGFTDVFVHDTQTGTTARVSVDSMGLEGNSSSSASSLSADGRYVTFQSSASNLVAGDMNGFLDTFRAPNPLLVP